jgi:hypothetical protein
MKTSETILAKAVKTRACPTLARSYGMRSALITITAQAYQLGGNQHPHFSVTADVYSPGRSHDPQACGCMHEEAAKYWPEVVPLIALHGSNADDGAPSYAEGNGWYNMAGALGGAGERYHRGNSELNFPCVGPEGENTEYTEYRKPSADECLDFVAEHLRISLEEATALRARLLAVVEADADYNGAPDWKLARREFGVFVDAQKERWAREAAEGVALIRALAAGAAVPA